MWIVAQNTRQSSRSTRKGKESTEHARKPVNESPGGDGSEGNSTDEYIKKLQAELAELKAAQGIASSCQAFGHKQRGGKGSQKQGAQRYDMLHLSHYSGNDSITVIVNLRLSLDSS